MLGAAKQTGFLDFAENCCIDCLEIILNCEYLRSPMKRDENGHNALGQFKNHLSEVVVQCRWCADPLILPHHLKNALVPLSVDMRCGKFEIKIAAATNPSSISCNFENRVTAE